MCVTLFVSSDDVLHLLGLSGGEDLHQRFLIGSCPLWSKTQILSFSLQLPWLIKFTTACRNTSFTAQKTDESPYQCHLMQLQHLPWWLCGEFPHHKWWERSSEPQSESQICLSVLPAGPLSDPVIVIQYVLLLVLVLHKSGERFSCNCLYYTDCDLITHIVRSIFRCTSKHFGRWLLYLRFCSTFWEICLFVVTLLQSNKAHIRKRLGWMNQDFINRRLAFNSIVKCFSFYQGHSANMHATKSKTSLLLFFITFIITAV